MKYVRAFLLVVIVSLIATKAVAQNEKDMLSQLIAEERETVDALVLYPEETKLAILESCLYPEVLVKLGRIQQHSQNAFLGSVQAYPREVQEAVWDLARYPGLISRIVDEGPLTRSSLANIADDYPAEIRTSLIETGVNQYRLLSEIDELSIDADAAFNGVLENYPPVTQEAFRHLLSLPEVLTMLTDDIELAILTGDVYRTDPAWVLHMADSLNLVVAQENARELEEWKQSLQDNPEVTEELQASAEDFANEYEYDDAYYEGNDGYYNSEPDPRVYVHHYYRHYPYWFGYPYWYDYPRWRPYPLWWDWGFYFTPNRSIVIINLPSYYFTHWYFFRPRHHYYYPHLSAHFVRHYYYHPRPSSSIGVSVEQWKRQNRDVVGDKWLDAGGRQDLRVDRIKEFGKFEMDREKYNRTKPEKQLSQARYLEKYQSRYTQLQKTGVPPAVTKQAPADTRVMPGQTRAPEIGKPKVEQSRTEDPHKIPVKPPKKEIPKQQQQGAVPKKDTPQKQTMPDMDKAKSHHKNTWEGSKRAEEKTPQPAKEPAKTQPTKKPAQKRRNG